MAGRLCDRHELPPLRRKDDLRHNLIGQAHAAQLLEAPHRMPAKEPHTIVGSHFTEYYHDWFHWARLKINVITCYSIPEDLENSLMALFWNYF